MRDIEFLRGLFARGKLSRRDFNTRLLAMGLSAAAANSVLVRPARAATPQEGGRFRIGTSEGDTTSTLDPALANEVMLYLLQPALRNALVEIDHEGNAVPELAESWDVSDAAKTWRFKLRSGVEFHNGKTLDVDDVIYSVNWHRSEESKSVVKSLLAIIESLESDGNDVVFKLKSGSADFPYILADYHIQIVPDATTDFSDGMGTGGYRLEEFEPGVRARLARSPNYWKDGRAHFDEVEIVSLKDPFARQSALITGEVDLIDKLDVKTVDKLKTQEGVEVLVTNGRQHYTFSMHCETPPFDNNDVRLALKYAIDRQDMLNKVLRGYGELGNDQPISPAYRFYSDSLPQRAYDPEKAKFHLKKAGMEGLKVNLSTAETVYPAAIDAASLYREHAAKAGIDITVVREPNDGYWSEVWATKPWFASSWEGRPTSDWMFTLTYAADAAWNETHWKNERFNSLLVEARGELDLDKRREMYAEMQRILSDDGGVVIPVFAAFLDAQSNGVSHGPVATNFAMDGYRAIERWWQA